MSMLTHHGGRLSEARAQYGGAAAEWLDLSTGINPAAWMPPGPLPLDWRALPDPAALAALERTASVYFAVDPALCLAVPGSEAGLRAVAQVLQLPGRHLPLTYSTHAGAFATAAPTQLPQPDEDATVLVLANPNNPDGTVLSREELAEALARQERAGGWLIVDEAFADAAPHVSVADLVAEDRRLIVTRSFGKFFGLAGVRLGFVLAPSAVLEPVRHLQGEWPVCAAAIGFGTVAYADGSWIAATRRDLHAAAARLDRVLERHALTPQGACPLFRLVETDDAASLFQALAHRHILTRPFDGHPRLLRFGLPDGEGALSRLDEALAAIAHRG